MKLTKRQLRSIIKETLEKSRVDEISTEQGKVDKPVKDFIAAMNNAKQSLGKSGAKKALGDLYQQVNDEKAGQHAERLLQAVTKIEASIDAVVGWLEKMPELTGDPWSHVRKDD